MVYSLCRSSVRWIAPVPRLSWSRCCSDRPNQFEVAIIDITGVPTVDTLVAQHLLKTVTAARLMGADCIISGIRPQIAQTIVHLGINLLDVTTKATLSAAFAVALQRLA